MGGDGGASAEIGVEIAQPRVLAVNRLGEIRGAVDDSFPRSVAGDEHSAQGG
jgi:hypothetical protein